MISKYGLALRAYLKFANNAVWQVGIVGQDFRTRITEICEHYNISEFEFWEFFKAYENRMLNKWYK